MAALILTAALLLTPAEPGQDDRVAAFGFRLPASCPSRVLWDRPCPGCGLIRSFVALAHGRPAEAVAWHRIGPLVFLAVLLQIPYRWRYWRHGERSDRPWPPWVDRAAAGLTWLVLVALLTNWVGQTARLW